MKQNTVINLKKIKIDVSGYHLLVKALINEKPMWLVLDTGASQTVLDFHLASEFSKKRPKKISSALSTGVSGEQLQTHLLHVNSFMLGAIEVGKRDFVMLDLSPVNHSYNRINHKPIQGILGGDILNKYNAEIDYKSKKLTLSSRK